MTTIDLTKDAKTNFFALIAAGAGNSSIPQTDVSIGNPTAATAGKNTNVVVATASDYVTGSMTVNYDRPTLVQAASKTDLTAVVPAGMTDPDQILSQVAAQLGWLKSEISFQSPPSGANGTVTSSTVVVGSTSLLYQAVQQAINLAWGAPTLSSQVPTRSLPGFISPTSAVYQTEVLKDTPYAYYRLNDTSGTTAADVSGNARNGTYVGPVTLNSGRFSPALADNYVRLGADSAYVDVSASAAFASGTAWSIEAWVNFDSLTQPALGSNNVIGADIIANALSGTTGLSFGAWGVNSWGSGSNPVGLNNSFCYWPAAAQQSYTGANTVPIGAPVHVVMTYNNKVMKVYVNGGMILNITTAVAPTLNSNLWIGRAGVAHGALRGLIGEVALYNKELVLARVAAHYLTYQNQVTKVSGQQAFTTPGTFDFVVPQGVFNISGVAVGAGGGGWINNIGGQGTWGSGGGGGGNGWQNNIVVTPGETLKVTVGAPGTTATGNAIGTVGGDSFLARGTTRIFSGLGGNPGGATGQSNAPPIGRGGSFTGDGGGVGGNAPAFDFAAQGGGGAGGYTGAGGNGTDTGNSTAGAGGGGSGGTAGVNFTDTAIGGRGGGVGLLGSGTSGAAVTTRNTNGNAGSQFPGSGEFGGGASASRLVNPNTPAQGGGLRLIWGPGRAYPNTNTADV